MSQNQTIYPKRVLTLTTTKRVNTEGVISRISTTATYDVSGTIDVDTILHRLASRAATSKSGRATLMWGLIKIKVAKREAA